MINKYPYTDFNEYNLDWVITHMKDLIHEWADTKAEWGVMQQEFTDLKDYVELRLSDESLKSFVSDKIDEMAADGTLIALIASYLPFITPAMFGAVGDGLTVDNAALNACFSACVDNHLPCIGEGKTYLIDNSTASLCGHYGVIVPGGITIRDCNFKLKDGCPDMTILLGCKYDSNPYHIENCTFNGELRTITSGTEDGGNHAIIFCDDVTMFPSDWQTYADITIRDCDFKNIQSYGIFPTPINNKLTVENCSFNCHGPGILSYAINTLIDSCSYDNASGSNTTVNALALDEIENFTSPTAIKKNIIIKESTSNGRLYQIQHYPQAGVKYGDIRVENCKCNSVIMQTYYNNDATLFAIEADSVLIKNCKSNGVGASDPSILLNSLLCDNVIIDSLILPTHTIRFRIAGSLYLLNCDIKYKITLFASQLTNLKCENCNFDTTQADGIITTRWDTIATVDNVYITNCTTKSSSILLRDIDADNVFVSGLVGDATQIRLFMAGTATDTNIYINGLIMPIANPAYNYFIENITGKAFINGIASTIRTLSVTGGVTNNTTVIS